MSYEQSRKRNRDVMRMTMLPSATTTSSDFPISMTFIAELARPSGYRFRSIRAVILKQDALRSDG